MSTNNIFKKLIKTEKFKSRLKLIRPELSVIGEYEGALNKILVETQYGICNCIANNLLNGQFPSIETAINKTEYYLNQIKEIHSNKYDYSKLEYKDAKTKIVIICPEHGEFKQLPYHHLKGQGCYQCGHKTKRSGWYKNVENDNKQSNMYILRIFGNGEDFMKFGVAVNLGKRISAIKIESSKKYNVEIVKIIKGTSKYCYDLEQRFKRKIWKQRRTYIPQIKFGGMYESFKSNKN